jgi:hypothetical protein
MRASEELSERSYGAYIVSVRPMPQSVAEITLPHGWSLAHGQN